MARGFEKTYSSCKRQERDAEALKKHIGEAENFINELKSALNLLTPSMDKEGFYPGVSHPDKERIFPDGERTVITYSFRHRDFRFVLNFIAEATKTGAIYYINDEANKKDRFNIHDSLRFEIKPDEEVQDQIIRIVFERLKSRLTIS